MRHINNALFKYINSYVCLLLSAFLFGGCNKLVDIPPPADSITTEEVFKDSADAAAAIAGIYSKIAFGSGASFGFCNGFETFLGGVSSDELIPTDGRTIENFGDAHRNSLLTTDGLIFEYWIQSYAPVYQANACIEAIERSESISTTAKNQLLGQAKFFRALFYFYLTNFFGDVPYVSSTEWAKTQFTERIPSHEIYEAIINDLKEAQLMLPVQSVRGRANKWAASALLARVLLYLNSWADAEIESSTVIQSNAYSLESDLNAVFSITSTEAILQWQLDPNLGNTFNATPEGWQILPPDDRSSPPGFSVSEILLNAFESGDMRRTVWVDTATVYDVLYYFPHKYKIGQSQYHSGGDLSEFYTILRMAEQYLIRAEARAQQGNVAGALEDLNMIRNRAALPDTTISDQQEILDAIFHERQVELFAELGQRWLDLKRTGKIDEVMSVVTPLKNGGAAWKSYQQLYPIPESERTIDFNLTQNAGY
jgi:starch-binding outer membrane protein, SusD/RagB family